LLKKLYSEKEKGKKIVASKRKVLLSTETERKREEGKGRRKLERHM
jgi:hypothetical protein